jgi:nucleoid-associated protein YgaU
MGDRSASPFERHSVSLPDTDASLREHVVVAGQTLSWLAHSYYGDWRLWRLIADRNGVRDPRRLAPGTRLLIPARELQAGRYESV